eukprot:1179513-Prorocentrum_minimum.AAC.1
MASLGSGEMLAEFELEGALKETVILYEAFCGMRGLPNMNWDPSEWEKGIATHVEVRATSDSLFELYTQLTRLYGLRCSRFLFNPAYSFCGDKPIVHDVTSSLIFVLQETMRRARETTAAVTNTCDRRVITKVDRGKRCLGYALVGGVGLQGCLVLLTWLTCKHIPSTGAGVVLERLRGPRCRYSFAGEYVLLPPLDPPLDPLRGPRCRYSLA